MRALSGRIAMIASRAIVRLVDDALKLQGVQLELLADESQDAVERFQNYGLTSRPRDGAEAIVLCIGGLRSHAVAIVVDDRRYRLQNLAEGEVALYDDLGQVVHLTRDGIRLSSPLKVTIDAPEIMLGAEGGQPVARVGDPVSGGVIQAGSSVVKAA